MTDFPALVYKSPGTHMQPSGGSYKYSQALTQEDLERLLADGWYMTSLAAIKAAGAGSARPVKRAKWRNPKPKKKRPSVPLDGINHRLMVVADKQDDAPPTRVELLQKASELGLVFSEKATDHRIAKLITRKLSGE
jgi:hypothetical protein